MPENADQGSKLSVDGTNPCTTTKLKLYENKTH